MKLIFPICLFLLFTSICAGQIEFNLNGYITDEKTGETLIGANIYNTYSKKGSASNTYGYFSIKVTQGEILIICSYIGYRTDSIKLNIASNLKYNFELEPISDKLDEVTLQHKESNIKSVQSSVISIPIEQIKNMPALLGEKDVLKSIQLLPGVQSGGEGTSGFYVRGGGPDQNLILLDGVNIYHSSHLLGFFSVFNEDAIKNIKLFKGGFPARFGGRLSSVLEINMKEGNMKEWIVEGGMGIISGKISVQGPIKKDKTSILISGRRTWLDLLKEPIIKALEDKININGNGNYYFYDINAKINHKFSDTDRLYISFYTGRDDFFGKLIDNDSWGTITNDPADYETNFIANTTFGLAWENITSSIRWNHIINDKIFSNTTLIYSRYKFDNTITTNNTTSINNIHFDQSETYLIESSDYLYRSGIEDIGIKIDLDYNLNSKHNLKFGGSYIKHNFFPGYMDFFADYENFQSDTIITFSKNIKPDDAYLYIEDLFTITNRLSTNLGIHYSLFNVNNKLYQSIQPRVSIRYMTSEQSSLKFSYATMQQNVHLLTNSSFGLPNDMWVPATDLIKPQFSKQISLGYNQYLDENKYEFSLELYYKKMEDLITFSEGTNLLGTNFSSWEERVETGGTGESKGMEIFIKKDIGRLTGWIGYTLSKSTRQFLNINLGNEYPYKFDRRHDLSIVSSYNINNNLNINATWVYGTGNAITMPIAQYLLLNGSNFVEYFDYGEKNEFRMQPYHRLDIGLNFTKEKKWGERTWTFSIYNLYNRKNPFFIYLQDELEDGVTQKQAKQLSLFPILPSIRYNFKF